MEGFRDFCNPQELQISTSGIASIANTKPSAHEFMTETSSYSESTRVQLQSSTNCSYFACLDLNI
jgi:hypothetical protein